VFITDGNQEALDIGVQFLRIIGPFYVIIAMKLVTDGVLRGAALMRVFMLSTMTDLVLRVAMAFVLGPAFGPTGVWLSWPVGWMLGTAISCYFYQRWIRRLLAKT